MDRELLLEIGCEELPASWLPGLTTQIGDVLTAQLREHRLLPDAPVETYSTPRRLAVRIAHLAERQTDLEELVNGPAVAAAFAADGSPTQAAIGFAAKQGVDVAALERVRTPKGEYVAFRKRQRGKAAVDVLPAVLGGFLRALAFPKSMHWDAMLEDGRGDLTFGRPVRWILFLYGGRVVPFSIARTPAAQTSQVQEVSTGAFTYGHRFLTTSGRAGRAIKVRSFDEYRARLLENFVILERSERHNKIARELDAKAQRLKGRVSRTAHTGADLLQEVPDLVEYPSVVAGTFAAEFARDLPEEVLVTTLVHHQHYFPVEGEDGRLLPAFLAVINSEPDNEKTISRNAERVVTARLRDARFFWETDRQATLESRIDRLSTLLFHKKLGSYREKAARIERLAEWIAREAFGAAGAAAHAATAARLAKADLTTDMVREFTELQGVMGGIYAREDGLPEEVWKAIYFHYLPIGVESDAPPSKAQLGKAAVTWAAVSLADKLDTVVGLFAAGEKPTGSRDPYGLRRAAQGVLKILVDLEPLCGIATRPTLNRMLEEAERTLGGAAPAAEARTAMRVFLMDRLQHLMQARGSGFEEVQIVTGGGVDRVAEISPVDLIEWANEWKRMVGSPTFEAAAEAHKRARKIVEAEWKNAQERTTREEQSGLLSEPAEIELRTALDGVDTQIRDALASRQPRKALEAIASIQPAIKRFFDEVRVVVPEKPLMNARLSLLMDFRDAVSRFGDPSVFAQK